MVLVGEPSWTTHLNFRRDIWMTLHKIAFELRCTRGDRPSVSRLLREIANGNLTVVPTDHLISEGDLHVLTTAPTSPSRPDMDEECRVPPSPPQEMIEPGEYDLTRLPDDDSPEVEDDDEP